MHFWVFCLYLQWAKCYWLESMVDLFAWIERLIQVFFVMWKIVWSWLLRFRADGSLLLWIEKAWIAFNMHIISDIAFQPDVLCQLFLWAMSQSWLLRRLYHWMIDVFTISVRSVGCVADHHAFAIFATILFIWSSRYHWFELFANVEFCSSKPVQLHATCVLAILTIWFSL